MLSPPIFVLYMKIIYFCQQESQFAFIMSILNKFKSALNFTVNILFIIIDAYVCVQSIRIEVREEFGIGFLVLLGMKHRLSGLCSEHFFLLSHLTSLQIHFDFYM